ncbi:pimeloyl-ACP methyl ester carboxylesterase [Allocatelliglobosispora scoriae]|uniref:Pimeloyl-ACP methyl ester carboxylesterase n=1 Tax=Allocatelliglobosispora scoriae TaxID=643052 RepID=A0A841BL66_9ACTN|nr:alpha/beta fold hydrolase [Allocatelliglobosispora scoriae]MBB5867986.1 pimeloyl-ACP methyl ester carboxylesterase [Allocatelliglobosispora scoriae]
MSRAVIEVEGNGPEGDDVTAIAMVLHGGAAHGHAPVHKARLAYLRMRPFATEVHRGLRQEGVAVWRLRYRYRGWNGADRDPVHDVEWALAEAAGRHPNTPVVLIGHSMGGRAALWAAGSPNVIGVCALAPWIEPADPLGQLSDRRVLIVHGDADRMTSPIESRRYAARAAQLGVDIQFIGVRGAGHTMLSQPSLWHRLAADFVRDTLTLRAA